MMVGVCGTTVGTKYCRLQRQLVFIEKIRLNRVRGETSKLCLNDKNNVIVSCVVDVKYKSCFFSPPVALSNK